MRRRRFLVGALGATVLVACGDDPKDRRLDDLPTDSDLPDADPCAPLDGRLLGTVPFIGETPRTLERLTGAGLEGRRVLDLSTLDGASPIVDTDRFYIRTAAPATLPSAAGWAITIDGLVATPANVAVSALATKPQGAVHIECSGNTNYGGFGLQSAARWSGAPLPEVLAAVTPDAGATQVRITGYDTHDPPHGSSTPGASWVFRIADLDDAFLATHMNGDPLPRDNGGPVRLVVPGWFGCTCIKWVESITFVDDTEPATSQMTEFASRTHQNGTPSLARDFAPATVELAATPVRVERWRVDGKEVLRVVGLLWGGDKPTRDLRIQFGDDPEQAVELCEPHQDVRTWLMWHHLWHPRGSGTYEIRLSSGDVDARRLDQDWYLRIVER